MDVVALLGISATVAAADGGSKWAVRHLPANGVGLRRLGLRRVVNRRGSLVGLPFPAAVALLLGLAIYSVAVVGAIEPGTPTVVGLALTLGGAAGNTIDRAQDGAVDDFVVIGRWPVFNLGDVAITVGLAMAVLGSW